MLYPLFWPSPSHCLSSQPLVISTLLSAPSLFYISCISDFIQYLSFRICLILLSIMSVLSSGYICVVTNGTISFFCLRMSNILCTYILHILFIYLSMDIKFVLISWLLLIMMQSRWFQYFYYHFIKFKIFYSVGNYIFLLLGHIWARARPHRKRQLPCMLALPLVALLQGLAAKGRRGEISFSKHLIHNFIMYLWSIMILCHSNYI